MKSAIPLLTTRSYAGTKWIAGRPTDGDRHGSEASEDQPCFDTLWSVEIFFVSRLDQQRWRPFRPPHEHKLTRAGRSTLSSVWRPAERPISWRG
jgi:hypothetical protein